MMSQLAALLLDLGVIGPPADVTAPRTITASSRTQYIRTSAPRQAVLYGAPWNMTGTVRSAGADKVGFNLRLRFRPVDRNGNAIASKTDTITLEGVASFAPRARDAARLDGPQRLEGDARGRRRTARRCRDAEGRARGRLTVARRSRPCERGPSHQSAVEAGGEEARAMLLRRLRLVEHLARGLVQETPRRARSLANHRSCGG